MRHFTPVLFAIALTTTSQAQLTVTDSLSNAEIAELLEGLNVSILNVEVDCPGRAMGHFMGDSEMEIAEGIVLTSGRADQVAGPVGDFASDYLDTAGDADLDISLGGGAMTMDACVLEFDCIPLGDTLLFNFSFGSEEYPEFVGSAFNDIFAIYLTGPGFPMPTNVAALPDATPVAINNVNAFSNADYYIDNQFPAGTFVSYDGFTTNLTAFAVVSPDDVYHFKVAIADVSDGIFDSGVFLEAFSFRSDGLSTGIAEHTANGLSIQRDGDVLIALVPDHGDSPELVITNMGGQVVHRARISSDRTLIDVSAWSTGIYTAAVFGGEGSKPVRFVK